jgi:SAM-dependent methyltransferase
MEKTIPKSKTRDLRHSRRFIGDIGEEIDAKLGKTAGKIRVLELGCGYGAVLIDLFNKYGARVELHGINRFPEHGNLALLKELAKKRGVEDMASLDEITIHHFDASQPWPLPDDHFDVVYSQSTFLWLPDKIHALQEINRIMNSTGVARVELRLLRPLAPPDMRKSIVIMDDNAELSFEKYIERFKNLKLLTIETDDGVVRNFLRAANQAFRTLRRKKKRSENQPYLRMTKVPSFDMGLVLTETRKLTEPSGSMQAFYKIK